MLRIIIFVVLFLWSSIGPVAAESRNIIVVHLASHHLEHSSQTSYNERNFGLGVRVPFEPEGWYYGGGTFRNSLDRTSVYLGVGTQVAKFRHGGVNVNVGAISGYYRNITPFLIPELFFNIPGGAALLIHYLPSVRYDNLKVDATVAFSLALPFP